MIIFWLILLLLLVLAGFFIAWPWWRYRQQTTVLSVSQVDQRLAENVRLFREHLAELELQKADGRLDELQFNQLKLEQERALLEDEQALRRTNTLPQGKLGVGLLIGLVGVFALVALALYEHLGSRQDMAIQELQLVKDYQSIQAAHAKRTADPAATRALIAGVEARLKQEPDNVQYWFILARNAMELGDFTLAANAYLQVVERDKESAMVMAEAAQAIFLRDGNQVSPPVENLSRSALALEPENTMALGLMGIVEFSRKSYIEAIKYWNKAVAVMGADSPASQSLYAAGIERARNLYLQEGGSQEQLDSLVAGKQLRVGVSLVDGLQLAPDQWVYIYARAWQGAKMPLAITRIKVADLPAEVTLTEAMAMSPAASLAQATQVELVARVSQDGTATAKPGDWQGSLGPVDMQNIPSSLRLQIDHQVAP